MKANARPRLTDVFHNPRHWNESTGCFIPAAWVAHVDTGDTFTAKAMADSREDAVEVAKREWPGLIIDTPAALIPAS